MHHTTKLLVSLATLAVLILGAIADEPAAPAQKQNPLVGTWKHLSNGDKPLPPSITRLKHFTPTHVVWVAFPTEGKDIQASAGGRYSYDGTNYLETIDFGSEGMKSYIGKQLKFSVKIDGDKLHQKGVPGGGLNVDEVWVRVK